MSPHPSKPRWWLAYSLVWGLLGLLLFIERLMLPQALKEATQIASVLVTLRLLYLWVRANAQALDTEWRERTQPPLSTPGQRHFQRVMRFHPLARRRPNAEESPASPSHPTY